MQFIINVGMEPRRGIWWPSVCVICIILHLINPNDDNGAISICARWLGPQPREPELGKVAEANLSWLDRPHILPARDDGFATDAHRAPPIGAWCTRAKQAAIQCQRQCGHADRYEPI